MKNNSYICLVNLKLYVMRKKEKWMFKGAIVNAIGKKGMLINMQENHINGVDYVYYITVRLEGQKIAGRYHPNDISEVIEVDD